METAALVILILAIIIEFMVGIALNINILLVYIGNLRNGLSLGPSDRVHLIKALVSVSVQLTMAAQYMIYAFWPFLIFIKEFFLWNAMINMFLMFYSYWLTAVLCVYYCTKITNCGHRCFVWLRRSLSSYLLHIFLLSALGSVALACLVFCFCSTRSAGNSTNHSMVIQTTFIMDVAKSTALIILGSFFPFAIAFVSTTITSSSLISHIWRMKQNNQGFPHSKLQPQINATRTMVLSLLISVIYFAMHMFFNVFSTRASDAVVMLSWFVLMSYPVSEAIIIIQSSSKLRSALLGKFCDRKRGNSET